MSEPEDSDTEVTIYESIRFTQYNQIDTKEDDYVVETPNENYEYIERIFRMTNRLQEYCKDNCLPIFNRRDTLNIIMGTLT